MFHNSYHDARAAFRNQAQAAGGTMYAWPLPTQQADATEPLTIDAAVFGTGRKALVLSSGLHGMEGFGRMLGKTAGFYAFTGLFAILVGLSMVNLIKPGLTNGEPNETIKEAFENNFESASESAKEKVAAAEAKAEGIGPGSGGFF